MNNLPHWKQLLSDRGILKSALDACWLPSGEFWRYPLFDLEGNETGVYRKKAFAGRANGKKYLWENPNNLEQPRYYVLPGFYEAIGEAKGRLILASGEPDVLAYRAAGSLNVTCWFGEGNTPDSLASDLENIGVLAIEAYPDLDDSGTGWAVSIRDRLADTDIAVHLYRLPGEDRSAYDINKLWVDCNFDSDKFWSVLESCPKLALPERVVQPELPVVRENKEHGEWLDDLCDQIEQRLSIRGYGSDGYSTPNIPCPMVSHEHDQKSPGAGWNREQKHLKCFKCAKDGQKGTYSAIEVAEALGIRKRTKITLSAPANGTSEAPRQKQNTGAQKTIYSFAEAAKLARSTILEGRQGTAALPILWHNLSKFGGMAQLIQPKKMVAIVGDSGDGKTSFMETQSDYWRRKGYSGIAWSPEWGIEEHVFRAVQRMGGPSAHNIIKHLTWHELKKAGCPDEKNYGSRMPDAQLSLWNEKLTQIEQWGGQLYFIDKQGVTVETLSEAANLIINAAKVDGITISYAMFDYAQLLEDTDDSVIKKSQRMLKTLTVQNDLVTMVGSQITKEAGKSASFGGNPTHHAMAGLRSDVYNLVIVISRDLDAKGEKSTTGRIRVAKNSMGTTGQTILELDTQRMMWRDCKTETVHLNEPDIVRPF